MNREPEKRTERSWMINASAWTDAVRGGAILSRTRGTNAAIIDAVLELGPKRVLDVGCGEGWLARALHEHGVEVFGFDVSPVLVEHAREAGGGSFLVCTYEEFVAEPERVGSNYDVVVCNFSLFDEKIAPVLRAIRSRLVGGGRLIIQTIHPWTGRGDAEYADQWRVEEFSEVGSDAWDPMPWYYRTLESWVTLLYDCGYGSVALREPKDPAGGDPLSLLILAESPESP